MRNEGYSIKAIEWDKWVDWEIVKSGKNSVSSRLAERQRERVDCGEQ